MPKPNPRPKPKPHRKQVDVNKYRKKKFVEDPEEAPTGHGGSGQAALA